MTKVAATKFTTYLNLFKIKQFIVLTILIAFIINETILAELTELEALDKRLSEIRNSCVKSSNVTRDQLLLIYKHKLFNTNTSTQNTPRQLQCYCACYLEEFAIFVDEKPNVKFLRENLPLLINDKKKADAVVDKCIILKGKDKCEIGFNFDLCVAKETDLSMC